MTLGRFTGFAFPGALVVLDTATGEVVRVATDGSGSAVLRGPTTRATEHETSAGIDGRGARSGDALPSARLAAVAPLSPHVGPSLAAVSWAEPPTSSAHAIDAAWVASSMAAGATAFDRDVLATYPFPIARAYLAFVGERDPRQRARLLIDTFAIALKVVALALTCQYLASDTPQDPLFDDLLAREFKRPLISTWDQTIQRSIAALSDRGQAIFLREIADAYQALETRCRDPFIATVTYVDESGRPCEKRSKLGKVRALLRYRNNLAHGFVQRPDRAEAELQLYEPLLRDVLGAFEFLKRYPLWSFDGRANDGRVRARRWMGVEPPVEPREIDAPAIDPDRSPLFLRDEATNAILPLHGFADLETRAGREEVLLYDGLGRTAIVYVSSGGERLERARRAQTIGALLDQKSSPLAVVTPEKASIDGLREAARRVTDATLERLRESGTLIPGLVRPRAAIVEVLAGFDRGDHRGLVFAGEGGSGKTTVAASLATERAASGDVVVFYRGQDLVDADLDARLLRGLMTRGMPFEDFLASVAPLFEASGQRLYLIVDGINETPGDVAALVRAFDAIVLMADSFPWFRGVATIRSRAYERLPSRAKFGADPRAKYVRAENARSPGEKEPLVSIPPLAANEVAEIYEAYRAHRTRPTDDAPAGAHRFRPLTAFAEIDPLGSTCALMKNPFMLRVVTAAYHGKRLSPELRFDEAMDLFVDEVVVEKNAPGGPYPERRRWLEDLVRAFAAAGESSLSIEALRKVPELRRALENPERDSAYVQLVELGVLVESWEGRECRVRFGFDRLFEDQLARLHEPDLDQPADLVALAKRAAVFGSLRGALAILLGRATHHGRATFIGEALRVARDGSGDEGAILRRAAVDALTALARSRDPSTGELSAALARERSADRARLLLEVVDRLSTAGELGWVERLLDAASEISAGLDDAAVAAELALRRALLSQQRGDWSAALGLLDACGSSARTANDEALAMRAELLAGEIHRSRGDLDRASSIFERASAWFTAHGELSRAAEARRQQAIVEGARGALEARRRLVTEAVDLARRSGDREAEFRCHLSRGQTHRLLGESDAAVRWFEEALAAAEALGDVRLVANALLGLGVARRESRSHAGADALFARAIELLERVEDKQRLAAALHNLALARLDAGRVDEALVLSKRSVDLYGALGEQGDVIEATNLYGSILGAKGEPTAAREAHGAALETAQRTGHVAGTENALFHLGCLDAAEGQLEVARDRVRLLEELHTKERTALGGLTHAALAVVVAAHDRSGAVDLESPTERLRVARAEVRSVPDVHAGPAVAWLAAARRALADGRVSIARSCLRELEKELDGRWYPGVSELAASGADERDQSIRTP